MRANDLGRTWPSRDYWSLIANVIDNLQCYHLWLSGADYSYRYPLSYHHTRNLNFA